MKGLVILFLTLTLSYSLAAKDTKCNKSGEYCLNHWDCCTNTCLSFLYKCSSIPSTDLKPSSPANRPPPYYPPVDSPTTDTYESLLESIFGKPKLVATAYDSEVNSIKTRLDYDKVEFKNKEASKTAEARTKEDVISTTRNGRPQCMKIGSKCYYNEDCCTQRCHGFLHQCVT